MASNNQNRENDKQYEVSSYWTIDVKNLSKTKVVQDTSKAVPNLPNVKYHFEFHPKLLENPHVFLFLEMPKDMCIFVNANFYCRSANYEISWTQIYTKSGGYCKKLFSSDDKGFIDGIYLTFCGKAKLTVINVDDLLTKKINADNLGLTLWENESGKDGKIVVDGKEIKIHKCVLQSRSTLFKSEIQPEIKTEPGIPLPKKGKRALPTPEKNNDTITIKNYGFKIVEKAVMFCYDRPCFENLTAEDSVNLLKFSEEFQMKDLKEKTEDFSIKSLDGTNACFYANLSIAVKAEKLYYEAFEFLIKCMKNGASVKDIEKLDAGMKEKIFLKAFNKA